MNLSRRQAPGVLICLTGVDGSGKTTQAKLLVDWLLEKNVEAIYIWNRGEANLRRFLISWGRSWLETSDCHPPPDPANYRAYQSRKSEMFRNPVVRVVWGTFVRLEHVGQIRGRIQPLLRTGKVVISDRYVWDSLIDLAVSFNARQEWLTSWQNRFTWRLVPRPAVDFFLDVPGKVALSRKDDIPVPEYVLKRIDLYRYLGAERSWDRLDGCQEPAFIHQQIRDTVWALLSRKN